MKTFNIIEINSFIFVQLNPTWMDDDHHHQQPQSSSSAAATIRTIMVAASLCNSDTENTLFHDPEHWRFTQPNILYPADYAEREKKKTEDTEQDGGLL